MPDNSGVLLRDNSDAKHGLCMNRLRTASLGNLALAEFALHKSFFWSGCHACTEVDPSFVHGARLLDVAVSRGQSACAELLASCGAASATEFTRKACLPDWLCDHCGEVAVSSTLTERRAAAGAALRAALGRAERLAAPMGLGIYQALHARGRGKMVPKPLINIILSFAAERPQIACVLEGLKEELLQAASLVQETERAQANELAETLATPDVEIEAGPAAVVQEQDHPSEAAGVPEGPEAQEATASEMRDKDARATNDLLTAVRNSRNEAVPLSSDGVICFRLTRKANAPHVNELLFDASGPLAELHLRVLDAGCEVAPEWSPVKALFVPLTKNQLDELTGCLT